MQQQTQTTETQTERVFGEDGQTVEENVIEAAADGEAGAEVVEAPAPKYRIGDQEFTTQAEALAYAQSQVSALTTETQVADAYRQGIRDGISNPGAGNPGVTPPTAPVEPELNTEELYTNPKDFLAKYAQRIKSEVLNETSSAQNMRAQSDQIWREFTDRHPEMADFRVEVEAFVSNNQPDVRGVIATKGRPASYDFIATKLKSHFERYANSLKPKRDLPNTTAGASPTQRATGVTPKEPVKKELSFSDQIRSVRKRR